jgi:hypothetical protein
LSRKGAREGELINIYKAAVSFFKEIDQVESSDEDESMIEEDAEEIDEKTTSTSTTNTIKSKADRNKMYRI